VEIACVLTSVADLDGAEGRWGVATDEAEWGVVGCKLEVGGDQLGAKHGSEEDM
jgi:hypothetical protein